MGLSIKHKKEHNINMNKNSFKIYFYDKDNEFQISKSGTAEREGFIKEVVEMVFKRYEFFTSAVAVWKDKVIEFVK